MGESKRVNNLPEQKTLRRELRQNATSAEATLWRLLNRSHVDGLKFRRQHGVGLYVLDFYCPTLRLNIELDGRVHEEIGHDIYDAQRTDYLNSLGITVLRYSNNVVFQNPEAIIRSIRGFARRNVVMCGYHKDELIE